MLCDQHTNTASTKTSTKTDISRELKAKMPERVISREELLLKLNHLKESTIQMNNEILRDESNRRRPPSEYLELYSTLTEQIHDVQQQLIAIDPERIPNYPQEDGTTVSSQHFIPNTSSTPLRRPQSKSNSPKKTTFEYAYNTSNSNDHETSPSHNFSMQSPSSQDNSDNDNTVSSSSIINQHSPTYSTKSSISVATTPSTSMKQQTPRSNVEKGERLIRVFINNCTIVFKNNENETLMDALVNKLRTRNIDARRYVAFIKDTNEKLDWSMETIRVRATNIELAEDTVELYHNFEKKTVLLRMCEMCRKSNILHASMCTKCKLTMCSKTNCRNRGESTVCRKKNETNTDSHSSEHTSVNFSRQILPFEQLIFSPSNVTSLPRERGINDNELNILVETQETPLSGELRELQNSYSTLPRNQFPSSKPRQALKSERIPARRDSLNAWEIPCKQITDIGRKVGSGSFGTVHEGMNFYHGTVAIKFLNVQNPSPLQYEAFRNEVAILKSTRHDNVLLFIGCILTPFLAIVTEWCKGSSLYKHLHVLEEHWNMYQLIDIAKQTATGMEYLHARDIYHRDMKSNNIFLIPDEKHMNANANETVAVEKWKVKIGDFGLAAVKSNWTEVNNSPSKKSNPTGSILWLAPEVITQRVADPYTQKSDVYSFGVVLYELCTGQLPFGNKQQDTILFMVGIGRLKPSVDDVRSDTPSQIKNLLVKCCEYDRDRRPLFVEINQILKGIKISRLKRAQSTPNLSLFNYSMLTSGASITDDDTYQTTPTTNFVTNL